MVFSDKSPVEAKPPLIKRSSAAKHSTKELSRCKQGLDGVALVGDFGHGRGLQSGRPNRPAAVMMS